MNLIEARSPRRGSVVIYVNKNRGVLAGDLTRNIRHIDKVTTVVNDGRVYDAVAIEKALGNAPRRAAQIN
jgi:hypothetical protein